MNQDEIKSLLVKVALVVLSPLAVKFHTDGSTISAIVTDLADAGILLFGVYDHWNMKKVPETAVVTADQQAGGK